MAADRTSRRKAERRTDEGGLGGRRHRHRKMMAAAGATTLALLVAGGVAGASAEVAPPPPAATLTASTTSPHSHTGHPLLGRLLHHTVHGQFVVRTKGGTLQTFEYDRGVLRSVTSTTIVVAPADTSSATVSATITTTTHFRGLPQSQLVPGDRVALVYQGGNAVVVAAHPPKASTSTGG